eukprot:gene36147-48662_t
MYAIAVCFFFSFVLSSNFIIPDVSIFQHNRIQIEGARRRFESAKYNFNIVGALIQDGLSDAIASGFVSKGKSTIVGKGSEDFLKASAAMMSFNMTNVLDWIKIIPLSGPLKAGDPIFTNSRFYSTPLWTLNPCRIVSIEVGSDSAHILYATTMGHLIAGEEMFRVSLQPQSNNVVFEIRSISKGAGWLGTLCLPLI